jgi:tetratricopeptide (TPR) repeat protein
MVPRQAILAGFVWLAIASGALGAPDSEALLQRHWFEARSLHFHTYSCGPSQEVARLTARLEQFYDAYSVLAGAEAVASPPIVVMAFPDHTSLKPFLPLYQGQPANLAAFFNRGSDENLIALSLSGGGSLELIFHEYSHLLLRHNEQYWPMWLKEGMAEIYATFEVTGDHSARIGLPLSHHLRVLSERPLMPLKELFSVTRESPNYNEREPQGMFYAESWLLTHCLMLGGGPPRQARFGQMSALLRQGQSPEQAFTNAFGMSLAAMEKELKQYAWKKQLAALDLSVKTSLNAPRAMGTRGLGPAEVCFRLGDQLLRLDRQEDAEKWFQRARQVAPASPLAFEGLGQLAARRKQHKDAESYFHQSLQHGSTSFLAHFCYAREKFQLTSKGEDTYSRLDKKAAEEIRSELKKSLELMPSFGPGHNLLGFFELVQGEDLAAAEQHLQAAVRLEPENESSQFTLAQVQIARNDRAAARRTLEPLRLPYVPDPVRTHAQELLQELGRAEQP